MKLYARVIYQKNMLIGIAIIIAIPITIGVGVKAYQEINFYAYKQAKSKGVELGKDSEALTQSLHSSLQNKNRNNAYALHCLDGGNSWENRKWKDEVFNQFWEQVESTDYSQSKVELDDSDKNENYFITISNIKNKDGESFSRKFYISTTGAGGQYYKCASLTPF